MRPLTRKLSRSATAGGLAAGLLISAITGCSGMPNSGANTSGNQRSQISKLSKLWSDIRLPPGAKLLAGGTVTPAAGGIIRAPNGVALTVPPGVVTESGIATIAVLSHARYDIHINASWSGQVAVTLPLTGRSDAILHDVGGEWVAEGSGPGQRLVWVTQLSLFSTLANKAVSVLCLTWDPRKLLTCLALKSLKYIDKSLALWIAQKLDDSCLVHLIVSGFYGPENVPLAMFSGPCVGSAGDPAGPASPQPNPQGPPAAPAPRSSNPPPPTAPPPPPVSSSPAPAPPGPATYRYYVYHTCANGACGLNLRAGPGYSSYPITRVLVDGDPVDIVCQTRGEPVSGLDGSSSNVWDKLIQGDYAADFYIDTPGMTGSFSPPIPQC
jgi:hypothetical protein